MRSVPAWSDRVVRLDAVFIVLFVEIMPKPHPKQPQWASENSGRLPLGRFDRACRRSFRRLFAAISAFSGAPLQCVCVLRRGAGSGAPPEVPAVPGCPAQPPHAAATVGGRRVDLRLCGCVPAACGRRVRSVGGVSGLRVFMHIGCCRGRGDGACCHCPPLPVQLLVPLPLPLPLLAAGCWGVCSSFLLPPAVVPVCRRGGVLHVPHVVPPACYSAIVGCWEVV